MSLGFETIEERRTGVDSYISASRLNCWLKCPLAWRLRYKDGIRTPPSSALFVGKAVHFALEASYRHKQLGAEQVVAKLHEGWEGLLDEDGATFDTGAEEQALQKQASDLVRAYLAVVPANEQVSAVEVTVESPLIDPDTGQDLGIPLLGVIDLVLENNDGSVICDFKTASRSSEPMEISHEIQLTTYAWLFRQITGRKEAGLEIRSFIKTKVPKVEFHPYPARSDTHFRRLFAVIREYLDALDRGRFNYRPGFGCAMCDYRRECQAWNGR